MSNQGRIVQRLFDAAKRRDQEVFRGFHVQPIDRFRSLVSLGGCAGEVEAERSSDLPKGAAVTAVQSAPGSFTILAGPPAIQGPDILGGTAQVQGQAFAAPEDEILALRFLLSTGATSSVVHPGTLNITEGTWTVDTGTTLDSITWGTLQPDPGRLRKYWVLPDGGPNVGPNSIAGSVSLGGSATPIGNNGRTAIQLYNTTTMSVTEHLSTAVGSRFMQPVPDDDSWWFVEWSNGLTHRATLYRIDLDLTGGPIVVNQTALFGPFPRLAAFSLTPSLGISAVFNGTVTAPTSCFRFPRDNSFTAASTGFTPFGAAGLTDVHFVQSGRPDATLNSWGPKIVSLAPNSFSHMSDTSGPVVETAIPLSESLEGNLESADTNDPNVVIALAIETSNHTVRLMEKSTGEAGQMFAGPTTFLFEAVWIEG